MDFKTELDIAENELYRLRELSLGAEIDEDHAQHELDEAETKLRTIKGRERALAHMTEIKRIKEFAYYKLKQADAKLEEIRKARYLTDRAYANARNEVKRLRKGVNLRNDLEDLVPWITRIQPRLVKSLKSDETDKSKQVFEEIKLIPDEILKYIGGFFPVKEWEQNERHINIAKILRARLDFPIDSFAPFAVSNPNLFGFLRLKINKTFIIYQKSNDLLIYKCTFDDIDKTARLHKFFRDTFLHNGLCHIWHHLQETRFDYKYSL